MRSRLVNISLLAAGFVLFVLCLSSGSVHIPLRDVAGAVFGTEVAREPWRVIVVESRFPAACTALLSGAALAVAGLLLQTVFRNPLAGPSILGISSGASLGVALVMLTSASAAAGFGLTTAVIAGAFAGAIAVILILLGLSSLVRNPLMLLITGILVSYLTTSVISLLNFFSTQEGVHSYVIWGLGSFTGITLDRLPLFILLNLACLIASWFMVKPLDALLLGDRYAESLGINIRLTRNILMVLAGLLTAAVTAYCGPIGFIGLVVPHIARLMLNSSSHRELLPATALAGAVIGLLCQWLSTMPESGVLPVNALTPVIGVPVIIYIIVARRRISYFN